MTTSSVMECPSKCNDSFLSSKQRKHICLKGILAGKKVTEAFIIIIVTLITENWHFYLNGTL